MSRNGKVIVAMSGGVDSSVAAALLRDQGYDCVGVFMRVGVEHAEPTSGCAVALPRTPAAGTPEHAAGPFRIRGVGDAPDGPTVSPPRRRSLKHGCCSASDAQDARTVAGRLGIPFYVLNFQADFERIIDYFVDEYRRARTPNPCVMCNTHVKFGRLLRYADLMDAEFVATGHYARILRPGAATTAADSQAEPGATHGDSRSAAHQAARRDLPSTVGALRANSPAGTPDHDAAGAVRLARARNLAKDQSYVLFGVRRDALPRCLFPLGEIADKAIVRQAAEALDLDVFDKPDSQEICFVPDNDYGRLVRSRAPDAIVPGEIRDSGGRVLATHKGITGFTVGQRRGLGLAAGRPLYVIGVNAATHTVTVGDRDELRCAGLVADDVNWLVDALPTGIARRAATRIRHMHEPAPGSIERGADGAVVARFQTPQIAAAPGQAAVFYDGDIVLGGGWIRQSIPATARTDAGALPVAPDTSAESAANDVHCVVSASRNADPGGA
ncbi:MAG: MnmA/TRMU family protein [Phycisphaerae bacterium]